jgi:hypothetical protein
MLRLITPDINIEANCTAALGVGCFEKENIPPIKKIDRKP